MLMQKKFSIRVLITRQVVKKVNPNKYETSYKVRYHNLCVLGPDPNYNTDCKFADETEKHLRIHYLYLKPVLSTHQDEIIRHPKWMQSDVVFV